MFRAHAQTYSLRHFCIYVKTNDEIWRKWCSPMPPPGCLVYLIFIFLLHWSKNVVELNPNSYCCYKNINFRVSSCTSEPHLEEHIYISLFESKLFLNYSGKLICDFFFFFFSFFFGGGGVGISSYCSIFIGKIG